MRRRFQKAKDYLSRKSKKKTNKVSDNEETPSTRATTTPVSYGDSAAPSSAPARVSSVTTFIAQPADSDVASPPPSCDIDPWTRAYEIFQDRESELAADYRKHLASLQVDAVSIANLSTPLSVESIVKQLLEDREKKQWQVPLFGKDIKIREQVERLAKFVLWSDPIVKNASGVSILLPLLTSGTKQNEAMLKGFNSIVDVQVYWRISEETYLQSSHGQNYRDLVEPLAKLYSHMVAYQARVICHLSSAQLSRAWQDVAGGNDWGSLESEVNELSKRCSDFISPLREQELRQHRDSQLQEMKESRNILDEIRRVLEECEKQRQIIYKDEKERNLLHDLESDYEGYKNFNPERVKGTCEWFFDDDRFRKWRDSSTSSLLWVSAGPGCGKSVLSRTLIDEERLSTHITTSTRRMDSTSALCAILHQLFTKDSTGSLIEYALSKKLTKTFSELWRILESCAKSPNIGEIVCLLDALDECNRDSRLQLVEQLKKFYTEQENLSSHPSKLKFLITSRPYDNLEASFRKFSDTTTYIRFDGDGKSEQISREINIVIDARMRDIGYGLADEDRRSISQRLKRMENRTYLWLHLTFKIIEQNPSEYSRSRSKDSEKTKALLQIVLAAERPLTLDEANIALTLALERKWYTSNAEFEKDKWQDPDIFKTVVKNLCGLLISVYDSRLFLLHQTVREFLMAEPGSQNKWKGRFNMRQSHGTLSLSCLRLRYLSQSDKSIDTWFRTYPFLEYANYNWLSHYIESKILVDLEECHLSLWNLSETSKTPQNGKSILKNNQIKIAIVTDSRDTNSMSLAGKKNILERKVFSVRSDHPDSVFDNFFSFVIFDVGRGSRMAPLIQKVNPFHSLYIAGAMGKSSRDDLSENMAEAVNWAISQNVDIISVSCSAKTDNHQLREAIRNAVNEDADLQTSLILVFCANADEGVEESMAFPACYENTIRVAANNKCGHLRPASQNGVDIRVPGEDLDADTPASMKKFVSEAMSYAAPVLAAGVTSLVLLLLRINNDDQAAVLEFLQKRKMMQVFAKMGNGPSGIQLSKLFGDLSGDDMASRWTTANFA
ncbi:hypothetical protein GGI43DRAFT_429787 [Trichoderma evansii]